MLYVIFAALSDAQAFVASINQAMGLPRGETQTWANPLALATPASAYVVPVDPQQVPTPFLPGAIPFPTDGSWAFPTPPQP